MLLWVRASVIENCVGSPAETDSTTWSFAPAYLSPVGKRVGQRLIQRHDRCIRNENVSEAIQPTVEAVGGVRAIVESVVEDLAEKRGERRPEPSVKRSIRQTQFASDELKIALAKSLESDSRRQ